MRSEDLRVHSDDLRHLADILRRIAKSGGGVAVGTDKAKSTGAPSWIMSPLAQCTTVADRLIIVAEALVSSFEGSACLPVPKVQDPLNGSISNASISGAGESSGLLAVMEGSGRPDSARGLGQSFRAEESDDEVFVAVSLLVPKAPLTTTAKAAPSNQARRTGTPQEKKTARILPLKPMIPKAPGMTARPSTVSSGARGASSLDGRSGGEAASQQELAHVLPATLYLALESIVTAVHAESGAIFMPRNDEMLAVCNVATRLAFPPSLIRHMRANAMTGGVFASGVALHQHCTEQTADDNNRKLKSVLIFPIFGRVSGGDKPKPIAVLQVTNKRRGSLAFDSKDEHFVLSSCAMIGQIMERHEVDWHASYYDPITLHSLAPFHPAPAYTSVLGAALKSANAADFSLGGSTHSASPRTPTAKVATRGRGSTIGTTPPNRLAGQSSAAQSPVDLGATTTSMGSATDGAAVVEDYIPRDWVAPHLIHRTTIPISLSRRQNMSEAATPIGVAPSLLEIDTYMSNLQDCWRRAVQLHVQSSHNDATKVMQLKTVREDLMKQKSVVHTLSEELRLQRLDAGDYHQEYVSLKEELQGYLNQVQDPSVEPARKQPQNEEKIPISFFSLSLFLSMSLLRYVRFSASIPPEPRARVPKQRRREETVAALRCRRSSRVCDGCCPSAPRALRHHYPRGYADGGAAAALTAAQRESVRQYRPQSSALRPI